MTFEIFVLFYFRAEKLQVADFKNTDATTFIEKSAVTYNFFFVNHTANILYAKILRLSKHNYAKRNLYAFVKFNILQQGIKNRKMTLAACCQIREVY